MIVAEATEEWWCNRCGERIPWSAWCEEHECEPADCANRRHRVQWMCRLEGYYPVSPNRTRGRHWRATQAEKRRVDEYLMLYARDHPVFVGPIALTIIRVYDAQRGEQPYDLDNIIGGSKELIDGLSGPRGNKKRGLGVFKDDDPRNMASLMVQQREAKPTESPGTVIVITGDVEAELHRT